MSRLLLPLAVTLLLAPPASAQPLRAEVVASGFSRPLLVLQDPAASNVFFVVEQGGRIRVVVNGVVAATDFLDLTFSVASDGERGLLGMAFAPDYATSRRFFVNFTNTSGHTVVARFRRSAGNPLVADAASRFDFLWPSGQRFISQPFANHNGGHLVFGPDGCLYIGMGDGGASNDPQHLAQNPQSLHGKMLRINVNVPDGDAEGYDIPPDNPYVGVPAVLAEIWSFGLRNPWRYSFDDPARGGTGAMLIGDVGQNQWEEIDYEPAGASARNYGWRNREGAHNYITTLPPFSLPLVDPIFEYPHTTGRSVTGGYVYRGQALGAAYAGRYFFGDFITSRIWSVALTVNPGTGEATASDLVEHTAGFGSLATSPSSFGVDASGEILIVSYGGTISRIINDRATNGGFDSGLTGWSTFGHPDGTEFVGGVTGGVLEFYRQAAAPGTTNQAVIFQRTGAAFAAGTALAARFDLGNSSTARKRIAVLVHDADFSDLFVCSFWLEPGAPMRTYRMRTHTSRTWTNATVSFYAASEGSAGGFYRLDNARIWVDVTGSAARTDCVDPTVPTPPGGVTGADLVANGGFSNGLSSWSLFGRITAQVAAGVLEFVRPPGDPAGVVLQSTGFSVAAGEILTSTFDLGNSSAVRKRVTLLVHDADFSDLSACTFWIPPGQALSTYTMRLATTRAWTNATVSIYASTIGPEMWTRADNVTLRRTPAQAIAGTECLEPGAPGPGAGFHVPGAERRAPASGATLASHVPRPD